RVAVWVIARIIIWVRCCTHCAAERKRAQPNANRRAGADAAARIGGSHAGKCDDHCNGGGASQAANILANHALPPIDKDPGSECRALQGYGIGLKKSQSAFSAPSIEGGGCRSV